MSYVCGHPKTANGGAFWCDVILAVRTLTTFADPSSINQALVCGYFIPRSYLDFQWWLQWSGYIDLSHWKTVSNGYKSLLLLQITSLAQLQKMSLCCMCVFVFASPVCSLKLQIHPTNWQGSQSVVTYVRAQTSASVPQLSGSITHWVPVITFLAVWLYSQQCQLVDFGWSTTFVQAEKWREWDTRNHGPKRVNSTDFGDPLTFHPAPSSAQIWNCPILWFMTKYFKKKNFSRQPLTPLNLYLLNMLWVFHHAEISI